MNTELVSTTSHFHFRQLRPGVYAALARPAGMAASNCGIVDLGGRTVVIDTSLFPQSATDLRTAAREQTGHETTLVLLTHHHLDHVGGCQAFDQSTSLFSSQETYQLLVQSSTENLAQNRAPSLQTLRNRQDSLVKERDTGKREHLLKLIRDTEERILLAYSTRVRIPDMSIIGQAAFYGTDRWLEFIPFPKAHCPGNAIIHLPQDGVIFMGDLLFSRSHPYMRDGDPQGWLDALEKIEKLKPEVVIPGHGGISSMEEIHLLSEYIHVIMRAVKQFVQAGKPVQALGEIRLPEPFCLWEPKEFLTGSLAFLYERLIGTGYVQIKAF